MVLRASLGPWDISLSVPTLWKVSQLQSRLPLVYLRPLPTPVWHDGHFQIFKVVDNLSVNIFEKHSGSFLYLPYCFLSLHSNEKKPWVKNELIFKVSTGSWLCSLGRNITSILPCCADGFPSESFHCHMLIPRAISLPLPDRSRTTTHQKPRRRMWDASVFLIPLCENTFLSGRRRATESVCIQMVLIKYFMLGLWHCPMGPLVSRDLFVCLSFPHCSPSYQVVSVFPPKCCHHLCGSSCL